MSSISDRWKFVCERVHEAALAAGRDPQTIRTIGVTKYVDDRLTRELFEAGCQDLGESRPQSLWDKAAALSDLEVRWHLIGHLQRNKSRRTLPLVHWIHSVDSWRIAEQLNADASLLQIKVRVMLEVNLTKDSSKTGMDQATLTHLLHRVDELPQLQVCGLMGMAGLNSPSPRHDFAAIRQLRDDLQEELGTSVQLRELSMGMSGDFEDAIAEGATMIRVGSILFEGQA
jgi:PLP dependent protein